MRLGTFHPGSSLFWLVLRASALTLNKRMSIDMEISFPLHGVGWV
jgi:hypothetical protein